MTISDQPVKKGQSVFFLHHLTQAGQKVYKPGVVDDQNEHVKAVRISFKVGEKLKFQWVPVKDCSWTMPQAEAKEVVA